jgi:O-antigen/teichoic acid export membrane protein
MKKLPLKKFLWNNVIIFILLNSSGALSYIFQIILGRALSPEQYGSFNSLLATSALITTPITILHLVLSRFIARIKECELQQIKTLLTKSLKIISGAALSIFLIGLSFSPWLKNFLHTETTLPIILMLLAACFSGFQQVLIAICEGMQRFLSLGIISGGSSLSRILFTLIFVVFLGWGIEGALLAVSFATCSALAYGTWKLKDVFRSQSADLPSNSLLEMARFSIPSFLMITMVAIMCNIDIILVRHYCQPDQVGYYATASILGRIAFFLPSSLLMVLFPSVAKATSSGSKDNHYLWISLGLTTILTGIVFLVFFFAGRSIVQLIYGDQYYSTAPVLIIVTAAMGLLAISHVIFSYNMARSEFGFLWPLFSGVILMLSLVFLYHESPETIGWILLFSTATIFFGTVLNRVYLSFFQKKLSI